MGWFSRNRSADTCKDCTNKCKERFEKRKALIQAAKEKAATDGSAKGQEMSATADRFAKYNQAMPRAKAAQAVYSDAEVECLTRITDPEELRRMGVDPNALRDDNSGFNAAVYRSQWDDSTILAYQGTDANSLNDWKTNIDNGSGLATDQYTSAANIAAGMHASGTQFDIAGHSLGGGLATEGGLAAPGHNVYTFNSAGLSDASLARNGASSWADIDSRTQAFRTENEFLTGIQEDEDPQNQIANAEMLRSEIEGADWRIDPMQITGYNAEESTGPEFEGHRTAFFNQVDQLIARARADVAQGKDPNLFPQARGQRTEVPGLTWTSSALNDRLSRLNQHTMDSMIARMEAQKSADEKALKAYTGIR
ncbi:MAG: DUF2974 domain-containing protein [Polyangiaceae bacterium]|nr:DUF2974 domain-containing protein [Polyangiaceae bacterium]NUQ75080.1 DUF2974 domain-containing protein [Polyangiaceae bacterium]